jgi:hypothetical protein
MEHLLNTNEDNREIFFNVSTQPVYGLHSGDTAPNKKMLMRSNGGDNEDTYLDVVNDKYHVVENREVLEPLHRQMINFFDPLVLEDVQIKDTIAANGLQCYAEYVFPSIKSEIETSTGHKTNLGLRFVVKNSFDGKGSVTFWSGVIDFFCTNGVVNGTYDITRKRHSKNFSTEGFIEAFLYSMDRHQESVEMYQRYADTKVGSSVTVQQLFDKLTKTNREEKKRDGGLADRLFSQWMDEVRERGNNLFSVQSAMTHYASHDDDGRFNLTKASDGGTLYKRSEQVTKWLSSPTWKDFVEHVSA